jgi:hypothetical protein
VLTFAARAAARLAAVSSGSAQAASSSELLRTIACASAQPCLPQPTRPVRSFPEPSKPRHDLGNNYVQYRLQKIFSEAFDQVLAILTQVFHWFGESACLLIFPCFPWKGYRYVSCHQPQSN